MLRKIALALALTFAVVGSAAADMSSVGTLGKWEIEVGTNDSGEAALAHSTQNQAEGTGISFLVPFSTDRPRVAILLLCRDWQVSAEQISVQIKGGNDSFTKQAHRISDHSIAVPFEGSLPDRLAANPVIVVTPEGQKAVAYDVTGLDAAFRAMDIGVTVAGVIMEAELKKIFDKWEAGMKAPPGP
jgi:hypothetical protein